MQSLRRIIIEAHRRSLWQVLGIYLVGSWVAYQVVVALTQGLGLPPWVPGVAVALFVIGLPIVLATAFVQEGLPGRRDAAGSAGESAAAAGLARFGADARDPTLFPYAGGEEPAANASAAGDDAASASPAAASAGAASRALRGALTWRRSLAAGVVAFALLGVGTTGFLSLRALGIGPAGSLLAAGVLAESDRIVIADFASVGGDTTMARLVTEAFRVDFARSTLVRPVDPTAVREVLRRMGRDDLPRLDAELAREIALRDGVHLVITGEVTTTGAGHVLTARLVSAETGEVVAAHRESAKGDDDVIAAIDRMSRALRARTGESLRTVRRAEPLAQVTTPSMEALRKFTEARRAAGWEANPGRARVLLEEAIALDSAFAAAHLTIATFWLNAYQPARALAALDQARRNEERLSPEDRIRLRAQWHHLHREFGAAAAAYEQLLALQPTNALALNNIGIAYSDLLDYDRAVQYYERASRADSTRYLPHANLGESLVKLGRFDEAKRAFERALALAPQSAWAAVSIASLPTAHGDYDAGEAALRALIEEPATPSGIIARAERALAGALTTRGRLAEAEARIGAAARAQGGSAVAERRLAENRFWNELLVYERPERARQLLPVLLRTHEPAAEADSLFRLLEVAEACGWVGDAACARRYLARAGRDGELPPWAELHAIFAHAGLALAENDLARALRLFRAATDGRGCPSCEQVFVGKVFELMNEPDSALIAYQRFLASPSLDRLHWDGPRGPALLRLAELHEQRGERDAARQRYAELIALWERADAELQPRVSEARRRLARLQPDG